MSSRQSTQGTRPGRAVSYLSIIPVYEAPRERAMLEEAITFLVGYQENATSRPFVRYDVSVRYSNGNQVRGDFTDKAAAITFLRAMT